jgi:thymidine kinase
MSVELILGPMFSGKTTEMIRRCKRRMSVGFNVVILNHKLDDRNGTSDVVTHDGVQMVSIPCETVSDFTMLNQYDVIAIDEAQFFTNLSVSVQTLANVYNKQVILACLSGDSNCEPWPGVDKLVALSDEIIHCRALCVRCHKPAAFTKRHVPSQAKIVIGSTDKYSSMCRTCLKS